MKDLNHNVLSTKKGDKGNEYNDSSTFRGRYLPNSSCANIDD